MLLLLCSLSLFPKGMQIRAGSVGVQSSRQHGRDEHAAGAAREVARGVQGKEPESKSCSAGQRSCFARQVAVGSLWSAGLEESHRLLPRWSASPCVWYCR